MARTVEDIQVRRDHRVPPQNVEAEESVLGAMMLSADAIADVVEILQPEDFYRSANGRIYGTLRGLYGRGEPVDIITAVEALRREGILEDVGGHLYVRDLVDNVPTPGSAPHYADIVAKSALRRRLITAAADIMELAYGTGEDADSVADDAEQRIYDVARREDRDETAVLRDLVDQAMLDLESMQNRTSAYTGLPTGFRDLDDLTSGLQPGNLVIIAARPGVGKSSLAINMARNVAVEGHSVAVFSLEMSRTEIGMRVLCAEARVPWDRIRNKRVGPQDWQNVVHAAETLHDAPLHIVDSGNVNIVDIRAKARRMRSGRGGLELIIVDYLQLMTSAASRRPDSRQQEVAEISRSLKLLAKELHIPVVALSQLNRNPETRADKRPQLSDLRECVPGDTLVSLADGRRLPIRDLVGTTPDVLAVTQAGTILEARSDMVWPVGVKPVYEVKFASGRAFRATSEHRLLGWDGWVAVKDLQPGSRLGVARRIPEPAQALDWHEDRVALLGQLIGDGSYLRAKSLRYTTASEENSRLVTRAATEQFGAKVSRIKGRGSWHQLFIGGNGDRWHPAGVKAWLQELGVHGQRSHLKRVPDAAFRLPDAQVATLLRHLWATDGCIHARKPGQRGSHSVYYATNSRGLAEDVSFLLLRFGVVARMKEVSKRGYRNGFHVHVSGATDQRWFLKQIGTFGPRVAPGLQLAHALDGVVANTNVDTLPTEVFDRIRQSMRAQRVSTRAMAASRGTSYGGQSQFAFAPSRSVVAEYAELLDDDALRTCTTDDLFWDRVIEVVDVGSELVYDITVPGPSNWIAGAGAVISHNSGAIEQDSDVVMFIHRDDVDPEKKRTAELIISKHRNGPTGSVNLNFEPALTQFRNAARSMEQ